MNGTDGFPGQDGLRGFPGKVVLDHYVFLLLHLMMLLTSPNDVYIIVKPV